LINTYFFTRILCNLAIWSTKSKFAQEGNKCELSKSAHYKRVTVIYMPCDFLRSLNFRFLRFGEITIC